MIHRILAILSSRVFTATLSLLLIFTAIRIALTQAAYTQVESRLAALNQRGAVTDPAKLNSPKIPIRENAAPLYQAAIELASSYPYQKAEHSVAKETEENFLHLLESKDAPELEEALRLLELGGKRPNCAFNNKYEQGFSMPTPNFLGLRALCRLALADAKRCKAAGHDDQAARRLAQVSVFLRRAELNRSLIGHAMLLSCVKELTQTLQTLSLHDGQLRGELNQLEADLKRGFASSIQGERSMGIDFFNKLQKDHHMVSVMDGSDGKVSLVENIYDVLGNSVILLDELKYLELMQRAEDAATSGQAMQAWEPAFPFWLTGSIVPHITKIQQRDGEVREAFHQVIQQL